MSVVVQVRGLVKQFPGQLALDKVDLALREGEIHGLVGENGSGKSTLIKCLAGYHPIDAGEIEIDGVVAEHYGAPTAHAAGLRFIYQDPSLFNSLSVVENLAIGSRFLHNGPVSIGWSGERAAARAALADLGVELDLSAPVSELTPAEVTMVAVARALQPDAEGRIARVLVLDEPTAALPEHEVESLFAVIRAAAARGVAILYVSHRLEEIFGLTDQVSVLRQGKLVACTPTAELDQAQLVTHIIGMPAEALEAGSHETPENAAVRLRVRGLTSGRLSGVDFDVAEGEVLGIAGLLGSGRSRIARVLFGAEEASGTFELDGEPIALRNPSEAIEHGIVLVPEERRAHSAFTNLTVGNNITITGLSQFVRGVGLSLRRERAAVRGLMDDFDVRPRDPDKQFALLSGGNQQKAVVARWIRTAPRVILLDEPTQGIDIYAKEEILKLIDVLAAEGAATIFISSDHTEYSRICDRVVVLNRGQIAGELRGDDITPERITDIALGGAR